MSPLPVALSVLVKQEAIGTAVMARALWPAGMFRNLANALLCRIGNEDACDVSGMVFGCAAADSDNIPLSATQETTLGLDNLITQSEPLWNPVEVEKAVMHTFGAENAKAVVMGSWMLVAGALGSLLAPSSIRRAVSRVPLLGVALLFYGSFRSRLRMQWGTWLAIWSLLGMSRFGHRQHRSAGEVAAEIKKKESERKQRELNKLVKSRVSAVQGFEAATKTTVQEPKKAQ